MRIPGLVCAWERDFSTRTVNRFVQAEVVGDYSAKGVEVLVRYESDDLIFVVRIKTWIVTSLM